MNIKKITTYLLQSIRKGERILKASYKDGFLITDGYKMFYLKSNQMEINPALIKDSKKLNNVWEGIIKECFKLEYELSKKVEGDLIDKYSNKEKDLNIYLNEKLLKFFDLDSVEFYANKSLSPVGIKENDEFIAAVCPIRMIEKEF